MTGDTGPSITICAHKLYAQAQAAIVLAQAIRDRAMAGPGRDIAAALVARDRLRALLGAPLTPDDEGGDLAP
jgi:hypothetical protein